MTLSRPVAVARGTRRTLWPVHMLAVTVPHAEVELASGLCWGAGIAGLEERGGVAGNATLVVGTDDPDALVAALGSRWPIEPVVEDQDLWVDSWKPWARAIRIGRAMSIRPPWIGPADLDSDASIDLVIDPGRAWGHGAHPTTAMVLELLVQDDPWGSEVLDVGCGSGVLSVAAARLGASRVVGVDIDRDAPPVTRRNAVANGVGDIVVASNDDVRAIDDRFDLVLANIGAATLAELAAALADRVGADGSLILSGLLDEQTVSVLDAYADWEVVERLERDGWVAFTLVRTVQSSRSSSSGS